MKKILIPFVVLIFLTGTSFSERSTADKEKDAIMQAIKEQTKASSNRDLNLLTSYWIQDESAVRLNSGNNNYNMLSGWKEIGDRYTVGIKNNPEPFKGKKEYSDIKIKVYKQSAWAVFKESTYNSDGTLNNEQIGTRFLEKEGGKWKIVYMAFLNISSYEGEQ